MCARQEVFPNANGRLARCEIEPAAAEIIAASGPLGLALLAPHYAQMPASVAAQLAASAAAVDKLPFGSLLPEHIELVVSTFERELSDGDSAFHTAATKFVCVSKLLSVDQQARLLRLLTLDALQGLLSTYGDHSPSVTRELLRQLADDPGTAFQSDRRTLFQLLTWKEACWYGAELETALLDLIPGWYAHCVRERLMSRRGLEHLAQSVQEGILGDDHSWGTVVELSESWAGTLPELIQLVSSAIQDL